MKKHPNAYAVPTDNTQTPIPGLRLWLKGAMLRRVGPISWVAVLTVMLFGVESAATQPPGPSTVVSVNNPGNHGGEDHV